MLNQLDAANFSAFLNEQENCQLVYITNKFSNTPPTQGFCDPYYDRILCWSRTPVGSMASMACPDKIDGVPYVTLYNVTRYCNPDGIWDKKANYSGCQPNLKDFSTDMEGMVTHLQIMYYMYWIGYSLSLVFLLIALTIFLYYKSLWCLRNIIHTNLILCFALHNFTWISYSIIGHEIMAKKLEKDMNYCIIPVTLLKYFIAAGFFWMFVEGFFLFITVMFSFYARRIRFWMCAGIGWGIPFLLILITSIAKAYHENIEYCWNEQYHLDYIFIGPILFLLFVNFIFLFLIMYVIVAKLQLTVRQEAERYKRAIKALFILCPLLGISYVLVLVQPHKPVWLKLIFSYYITIMTSSQVRLILRKAFRRWKRRGHRSASAGRESMRSEITPSVQLDLESTSPLRPSKNSVSYSEALHGRNGIGKRSNTSGSVSGKKVSIDADKQRNVIVMDQYGRLVSASSQRNLGSTRDHPSIT